MSGELREVAEAAGGVRTTMPFNRYRRPPERHIFQIERLHSACRAAYAAGHGYAAIARAAGDGYSWQQVRAMIPPDDRR